MKVAWLRSLFGKSTTERFSPSRVLSSLLVPMVSVLLPWDAQAVRICWVSAHIPAVLLQVLDPIVIRMTKTGSHSKEAADQQADQSHD